MVPNLEAPLLGDINKGNVAANTMALQSAVFNLQFEIAYKLQDIEYQTDRLITYRKKLVNQMSKKVSKIPKDNSIVRQHIKYVDLYSEESNYQVLTYEDTLVVREEMALLFGISYRCKP